MIWYRPSSTRRQGGPRDAVALLEAAVVARPSEDGLTVALSRLYSSVGDLKKAEVVLARRLAADAKSVAVRAALVSAAIPDDRAHRGRQEGL